MDDPANVRVEGPLASLLPGFCSRLTSLGYSPGSAAHQLRLVAHLSRWMLVRGLADHDLSPGTIEEFFRCRRKSHSQLLTARALAPFLGFLADLGLTPAPDDPVPVPAWEETLGRFGRYLAEERGLRPRTVENYLTQVRAFLRWRADRTSSDLGAVSAGEVTGFLLIRGTEESAGSVRVAVTALRALLRWMYLTGIIDRSLAEGIVPVAYSAFGGLPKALSPAQVLALMGKAAASAAPHRDRALVLMFSRLGLRSSEAAGLTLDDLHWRTGTVVLAGKGGAAEAMPLPADVGEAVARYLEHERPATDHRHVFLQVAAPHAPLGRTGVSSVIRRLGKQAGLVPPVGAHRLRHSAATGVVAAGGTLAEAAQLLRHADPAATLIYAKVDLHALGALASPWPEADAPETARLP
jgi:integrase/recombinase XerD